jgi:hypothetical protein
MKMIAHQHIGVNSYLELPGCLPQPPQKTGEILFINKYGLPVMSSLNNVMWLVW